MRVNNSGNRAYLRDSEDLETFTDLRPRAPVAPSQRMARPSAEAAPRRNPWTISDEQPQDGANTSTDSARDDASSLPSAPSNTTAAANARLLSYFEDADRDALAQEFAPAPAPQQTPGRESATFSFAPTSAPTLQPSAIATADASDLESASLNSNSEISIKVSVSAPRQRADELDSTAALNAPAPAPASTAGVLANRSAPAGTTAATALTPTAAPAPTPSGTNETPVSTAWLQTRETALAALRTDYRAALAHAQSDIPVFGNIGPGWVTATPATYAYDDNNGPSYSPGQAMQVLVTDPTTAPVQIGWDEGGPVMQAPAGRLLEFNEAAFAQFYQAQAAATQAPSTALQTLATAYASSPAAVFTDHPGLWELASCDAAQAAANPANAGPAPAGVAMGNASQLGMTDLYLADPQIAALIAAYGGTAEPAASPMALEQVRLYGQNRYNQLTRLGNAMQSVRDQYSQALANAQTSGGAFGGGPGWVDRPIALTTFNVTDESGQSLGSYGNSLTPTVTSFERVFDPDAFTAWYIQQPGLANQAFADHYGASRTEYATDESGRSFVSGMAFANSLWSAGPNGSGMRHAELAGINLNDPPDLHHAEAVGFDFAVGWSTSQANIDQGTDWFETVAKLVVIAAVAWVTAGTLGPALAGSMGMSTAAAGTAVTAATLTTGGLIVSAAVVGAATSLASGLLNDNLTLQGVLRGALAGALTAGLMQGVSSALGATAASPLGTLGTIAARTTVQGAVQALMGGKFADGALAGFASGLAEAASANMLGGIDKAVSEGSMTASAAVAAKTFARVFSSAIRAAGSPGDPTQAFASAFLDDVFKQIETPQISSPVTQTAFDDEGRLNLGIVDPPVTETQSLELTADPLVVQGRFVPNAQHDSVMAELNAEFNIDAYAPAPLMDDGVDPSERDPNLMPVGWVNDVGASAAAYAQRLASRVGGELGDLFQRAARAAGAVLSYGDIAPLEAVKVDIRNYLDARSAAGGLSEAEIILFGVLYAANETLFPTNAVDFAGGIGKGIKAAGALVVAGRGADVLVATTRAVNIEQAVARQVQAVEQAAKARGLEVIREVPGVKGAWNDGLNTSLKPGAVYLLDNGHAYMTDALGRVSKAEAVLDLGVAGSRSGYQQLIVGQIGGPGYEGGHLIATLFGGAGEKINLIPQLVEVNRVEFRAMERTWADAVTSGKVVKVELNPIYSGKESVPSMLTVRYWIDDKVTVVPFRNKPGG